MRSMKTDILILSLIILIPSSHQLPIVAIPVGNFYITLVEILIFILVFLWFLRVLLTTHRRREKPLFAWYVFSLLGLYTTYIIVGLFQRDAGKVLGDFRQYMPLVLYFPLMSALRFENDAAPLRRSLFWALVLVSIYVAILFAFFKEPLIAYAYKAKTGFTGERIFIDNSVFLFLAYLGFMLGMILRPSAAHKERIFYIILLFLCISTLLIMQVRTFWVATAIILVLAVFSHEGIFQKFKYLFSGAVAILLVLAFIFLFIQATGYQSKALTSIQDRFASFLDLGKIGQQTVRKTDAIGSIDTRYATAKHVFNYYMSKNWFFGLGFGAEVELVNVLGTGLKKYQIDNGYLTLLAKFGAFGLLFYAGLTLKIVSSLLRIIFNRLSNGTDSLLAKSFLYAIVAMAIGSLFTSIFIREQVCIVSFVIMLCEIELMNGRLAAQSAEASASRS